MPATRSSLTLAAIVACCIAGCTPIALGQDSTFTYQGRLKLAGVPVTGTCDFKVSLWDALSGGTQVAGPVDLLSVSADKGLFTIAADFGSPVWDGQPRFLQIAVRSPAGSGSYTTLTPRQSVHATPYALNALTGGGWLLDDGVSSILNTSVGIGTNSPASLLQLVQTTDAANQGLWVSNSNQNRSLQLWVDAASRGRLQVGATADTSLALNGDGQGSVGVGIVDPEATLHARQNYQTNGTVMRVSYDGPNAGSGASSAALMRITTTSQFRPLFLAETAANDPAMFVGPSGWTGLGTVFPTERLHVNGNIRIEGEGYKPTNPNTWTVTSDERIKDDVQPIVGALELLEAVRPVTFRYTAAWAKEHGITRTRREYGVIAQEFAQAFPDFVNEGPFELPDGSGRALMVDSSHLTILAVSAIQQLNAENASLKESLRAQSERVDDLERQLAEIRRMLERR